MRSKRRNTTLRSLAAAALLATLTAPVHTQISEAPDQQIYDIDAQVQDLGALADLLESWHQAPLQVLTLDLGPKSGAQGERLFKARLRSPGLEPLFQNSKDAEGIRFTSVRGRSIEASPASFIPPVKNEGTGRYDLNFTHLDFGPDAEPGKIAVRPEIHFLDGSEVSIEGFMIPLQWDGKKVSEFMLVAHLAECCFGGAPEYDQWIHALAVKGKPVEYQPYVPIRIQGKLKLPSVEPNKQDPDFDVAYRLINVID